MANIKDVAKEAGVSVTTVSRVMNDRGYISEKTRKKVYDAMDNEIKLTWKKDDKHCTLSIDLNTNKSIIQYIDKTGDLSLYNI